MEGAALELGFHCIAIAYYAYQPWNRGVGAWWSEVELAFYCCSLIFIPALGQLPSSFGSSSTAVR